MVSRVRLASVNADELSNQASVPGRADWLYENSSNLLMSPDEPSSMTLVARDIDSRVARIYVGRLSQARSAASSY